jgi:tryptophanyl-tRNA synthetase
MGLDDPTTKMSKSAPQPYHAVGILDAPETIAATLRRAVTDSGREIVFSDTPAKAGVTNLLTIYQALSGQTREAIEAHFAGKGYGDLKRAVAEVVIDALRPIQQRYKTFSADPATLDQLLQAGADAARQRAAPMLRLVKERMGLLVD